MLVIIWINISTISGGNSIAPFYKSFDLPTFVVDPSSSLGRSIILNSDLRLPRHPSRVNLNLRVSVNGLIAIKIEAHKAGHCFIHLVREVDKEIDRQLMRVINDDRNLLTSGTSIECLGISLNNLSLEGTKVSRRRFAIDMTLKKSLKLRTSFFMPVLDKLSPPKVRL